MYISVTHTNIIEKTKGHTQYSNVWGAKMVVLLNINHLSNYYIWVGKSRGPHLGTFYFLAIACFRPKTSTEPHTHTSVTSIAF